MKSKIFISCKKATELMSKSFEEKLTIKEQFLLRIHLFMCKTCLFCNNQLNKLQELYLCYDKAIFEAPVPQNLCLPPHVKQKIINALR